MAIDATDPKTTWEKVQNNPEAILLDVRTVEEFSAGHPQGSLNIPILHMNARTGQRGPNTEFARVVSQHIPKEKVVFVTCRSGQRSLMAAMQMEALGYSQLINVKGGFHGSEETAGWQALGLPVGEGHPPERCYETLLGKAAR